MGEGEGEGQWSGTLFLPVVAQLNSGTVKDAAEGDGLNLPVWHRVAEQTDAGIHGLLGVVAGRAEVICSHTGYLVGMKIDHLKEDGSGLPANLRKCSLTSTLGDCIEEGHSLNEDRCSPGCTCVQEDRQAHWLERCGPGGAPSIVESCPEFHSPQH